MKTASKLKDHKKRLRTCIACRNKAAKDSCLRFVKNQDGNVLLDKKMILPGRGAYICNNPDCLKIALKRNAFKRAIDAGVDLEYMNNIFSEGMTDE